MAPLADARTWTASLNRRGATRDIATRLSQRKNLPNLRGVFHDEDMTQQSDIGSPGSLWTRTTLRPREAACVLGVSERTVTNMLRRGELRNVATQRCRRVDPEELARRLSGNPAALVLLEGLLDGSLAVATQATGRAPVIQRVPTPLRENR
jgi:excisionase family DNA binding protein